MLNTNTDSSGGAVTTTFNAWVAEQQKALAQVTKQGRLLKEEQEATRKMNNGKGAEEPPSGQ